MIRYGRVEEMKPVKNWSLRSKKISAFIGMIGASFITLVGLALLPTPFELTAVNAVLVLIGVTLAGLGLALVNAFYGVGEMLEGRSGKTFLDKFFEAMCA
jgi:hypothetical protein